MANRWADDAYPTDYQGKVQAALGPIPHDFFIREKANWLLRFCATHGFGSLLDIGCGIGLLHRYLKGLSVTGIDVSTEAVAEADDRNPSATYSMYDGHSIPSPDGSFDMAIAVTVMHHVPPDQWQGFVREAARVLRPDGALVVIEHNPLNPLTKWSVSRSELDYDAVLLRAGETEQLMKEAGLDHIATDYLFFTPFSTTQPIDRLLRRVPLGAQYASYGFR